MIEQVVILAGGKGTRLRPLTYEIPKPMVPVKGKPFLEHQMMLLGKYGFTHFLLCTGYLSKVIEDYLEDGSKWGWKIEYSIEQEQLGTGGGLKLAESKLEDEFLLLNGDTLLFIDYCDLVNNFSKDNVTGYIVVYSNELQIAPNNIGVDDANFVIDYSKQNPEKKKFVDAGAQVFRKKILERIPEQKVVSLEMEIFPQLIREKNLKAYISHERFYDMGTPERLALLEKVLP